MSYSTESISEAVDKINSKYYLPAIQREFVWDEDQIVRLFDSLMREYPIGSFLLWKVEKENKEEYVKYKFIQNYTTNKKYINHAALNRNQTTEANGQSDIRLVLDGQQRLSSLYIGLKGSYTSKEKWKQYNNPDAWKKKKLYLNLLSDPEETTDGDIRLQYEFEFKHNPENNEDEYWYRVGEILNFDNSRELHEHINEIREKCGLESGSEQEYHIKHNLTQLHQVIEKDEIVNYYTEKEQDMEKVLDIFIRTNDGGTQLTKSDLLLSMAVGNWAKNSSGDEINAREEITNFVDHINQNLNEDNDFDKDFVLKSSLVLSELPVRYKVDNFTASNLEKIKENWEDIKKAIEKAVKLVNSFGVDSNNLTSQNALIPIAYFYMKNPKADLYGENQASAETRRRIQKWFFSSLLNGTFGGQSDTVLRDAREAIEADEEFPVEKINSKLKSRGKTVGFNEEIIDNILGFEYGKKRTFLALTLLYDRSDWGHIKYHVDHIFPDSKFDEEKLRERGYSEEKISRYMESYNDLGNLQLLTGSENRTKNDEDFKQWIKQQSEKSPEKHLIPQEERMHDFGNFLEFKERRESLIEDKLMEIFGKNY
ncbi:MAG: DUF262 domain-containing protein [Candidatus Nanohalobium sp.]